MERELFKHFHRRLPIGGSSTDEQRMITYTKAVKQCPMVMRYSVGTIVGWYIHVEFEFTPWKDNEYLYYSSTQDYKVPRKYLTDSGNLKDDVFKEWLKELDSQESAK